MLFKWETLKEVGPHELGFRPPVPGKAFEVELAGGQKVEVWRADDLTLGQPVALKFLPPHLADDADRLQRFRKEVAVARKVSHPNCCRVYDLTDHAGPPFLSMEYIDGESLDSLLKRVGRLPEEKAIEVARQLCSALAAVHEQVEKVRHAVMADAPSGGSTDGAHQ